MHGLTRNKVPVQWWFKEIIESEVYLAPADQLARAPFSLLQVQLDHMSLILPRLRGQNILA